MTGKLIEIEGIGKVRFVKSKRARSARITIKPDSGVKVTVPFLMPYWMAKSFVVEKKQWILKNLKKQQERSGLLTVFDEKTVFKTNLHRLVIERGEENKLKSSVTKDEVRVIIPKEVDIYMLEAQQFIRKSVEESWRIEAKMELPRRTKELAENFGFNYKKVTIKNSKSRWGSCSSINNINYSLHLMRVPKQLQDYVILHELAHTVQKNHQAPFWKLLDEVTNGNAKQLDKQLKQFSTKIY